MDSTELAWRIPVCVLLVGFSALFSGLTLGLCGLDKAHLQVLTEQEITNEETRKEAMNAAAIIPIRDQGNLLLSTLITGNVLVNASISILLADMTSGLIGLILSTVILVLLGELIPQAVGAKYGLIIGGNVV